MAMNDFVPVSWNGEAVSTDKLNQMANNDQYLFDRTPRVRYSASNITRDNSVKIMSGKTPFHSVNSDFARVQIYFGSFFTAGSFPSVTTGLQTSARERKVVSIHGLTGLGSDIDHTGFEAHLWTVENDIANYNPVIESGGFVHWIAVGY